MFQRKYLILLSSVGFWVSFDQVTKLLMLMNLHLGESRQIVNDFFSFTLVRNSGAAFGLLATLPVQLREPFFLVVPAVTLALVLFVFARTAESQQISLFALSAVVGGALGNLVDRLRLTYVIDFLDFHWKDYYHFPAFNVADCAITIGVAALLFSMTFEKSEAKLK